MVKSYPAMKIPRLWTCISETAAPSMVFGQIVPNIRKTNIYSLLRIPTNTYLQCEPVQYLRDHSLNLFRPNGWSSSHRWWIPKQTVEKHNPLLLEDFMKKTVEAVPPEYLHTKFYIRFQDNMCTVWPTEPVGPSQEECHVSEEENHKKRPISPVQCVLRENHAFLTVYTEMKLPTIRGERKRGKTQMKRQINRW